MCSAEISAALLTKQGDGVGVYVDYVTSRREQVAIRHPHFALTRRRILNITDIFGCFFHF